MTKLGNWTITAMILLPVVIITIGLRLISAEDYQALNELGSGYAYVFFGTIVGGLYFLVGEAQMANNNRSYLANPWTDLFAFVGSAFIVIRGLQIEEYFFALIGSTIYTIHLCQVLWKQGFSGPNIV